MLSHGYSGCIAVTGCGYTGIIIMHSEHAQRYVSVTSGKGLAVSLNP